MIDGFENDEKDAQGSKYDKQSGCKGTGDSKYDKDLESRQDQSNRDREEQQGKDEET